MYSLFCYLPLASVNKKSMSRRPCTISWSSANILLVLQNSFQFKFMTPLQTNRMLALLLLLLLMTSRRRSIIQSLIIYRSMTISYTYCQSHHTRERWMDGEWVTTGNGPSWKLILYQIHREWVVADTHIIHFLFQLSL